MPDTLVHIAKVLNAAGILWGLGGSQLLYQHGLITHPRDIDIMVAKSDIEKADAALSGLGKKLFWEMTAPYETYRFLEYIIASDEVDVMCGFSIRHSQGLYSHTFDAASVSGFSCIGGVSVPLMALEDWYVLYQLIPDREAKVLLIENHLIKGVLNRPLLSRALDGSLPSETRARINALLQRHPQIGNSGAL